jgi:hypothetical protein
MVMRHESKHQGYLHLQHQCSCSAENLVVELLYLVGVEKKSPEGELVFGALGLLTQDLGSLLASLQGFDGGSHRQDRYGLNNWDSDLS